MRQSGQILWREIEEILSEDLAALRDRGRHPNRRAPQASPRPWLPSVATQTVRSPVIERCLPFRSSSEEASLPILAFDLRSQQSEYRIGRAERFEAGELRTKAAALVLVVNRRYAEVQGQSGE